MPELDLNNIKKLAEPLIEKVVPERKNDIEFRIKLDKKELPYRAINKLIKGKFIINFNPDYWLYNDSKHELKKLKGSDKVLKNTILHELCHIRLDHIKEDEPSNEWERRLCALDNELSEVEVDIEAKKIAEKLGMDYIYNKDELIIRFSTSIRLLHEPINLMAESKEKDDRMKKNFEIDQIITRIYHNFNEIKFHSH